MKKLQNGLLLAFTAIAGVCALALFIRVLITAPELVIMVLAAIGAVLTVEWMGRTDAKI